MTAAAWKKFDGGMTGQSTTSTPWKFDAVSQRNLTAPGSISTTSFKSTLCTFIVFLLAKDSLINSSHASHPIAGQGATAWRSSALSEYECFESGKILGKCDEGILRGHVGVKNICPPYLP